MTSTAHPTSVSQQDLKINSRWKTTTSPPRAPPVTLGSYIHTSDDISMHSQMSEADSIHSLLSEEGSATNSNCLHSGLTVVAASTKGDPMTIPMYPQSAADIPAWLHDHFGNNLFLQMEFHTIVMVVRYACKVECGNDLIELGFIQPHHFISILGEAFVLKHCKQLAELVIISLFLYDSVKTKQETPPWHLDDYIAFRMTCFDAIFHQFVQPTLHRKQPESSYFHDPAPHYCTPEPKVVPGRLDDTSQRSCWTYQSRHSPTIDIRQCGSSHSKQGDFALQDDYDGSERGRKSPYDDQGMLSTGSRSTLKSTDKNDKPVSVAGSKNSDVPCSGDRGGIMDFEILPIKDEAINEVDPYYGSAENTGVKQPPWKPDSFCIGNNTTGIQQEVVPKDIPFDPGEFNHGSDSFSYYDTKITFSSCFIDDSTKDVSLKEDTGNVEYFDGYSGRKKFKSKETDPFDHMGMILDLLLNHHQRHRTQLLARQAGEAKIWLQKLGQKLTRFTTEKYPFD